MTYEVSPWGCFSILLTDKKFQINKLSIDPGKRISLQSHKLRAEHWFIVSGRGSVYLDNEELQVRPGDSLNISIGAIHRITCISENPLIFIEIQKGLSFGEDDIIRYEDDFGRN